MEMMRCLQGAIKERNGWFLKNIKKYIVGNYKLNLSASNSHLKRELTSWRKVQKSAFIYTTGKDVQAC